MYKIKLNEHVSTIPTIGFNVETVEPKNGLSFTVWDVGGQEKIRRLWEHYYANSDGLIFVVDSNDPARMEEAREELMGIVKHDRMLHVPVVVFAIAMMSAGAEDATSTAVAGFPSSTTAASSCACCSTEFKAKLQNKQNATNGRCCIRM